MAPFNSKFERHTNSSGLNSLNILNLSLGINVLRGMQNELPEQDSVLKYLTKINQETLEHNTGTLG